MASRFTPPTPRSRRLGRELRRLRDAAGLTNTSVAQRLQCSPSRIARIESGEIRVRPGDVMELLQVYGVPADTEIGTALIEMARQLREVGWWQRLETLSQRYLTYIAFESEAKGLKNFEPTLIPGLLQTEGYARAVISAGDYYEADVIEQHVQARMKRQEVLQRERPLRLCAVISESVLMTEVGGPDVLREQLEHLMEVSERPNVTIQVLPFAAGAHIAAFGSFVALDFEEDPELGYIETLAGELFLESPRDIKRLTDVYSHLQMMSLSPAESARRIKERSK